MKIIIRCELTRVPALDRAARDQDEAQLGFALGFVTGVSDVAAPGNPQTELTNRLDAVLDATGTPFTPRAFRNAFGSELGWLCPWTWTIQTLGVVAFDGSSSVDLVSGFRTPPAPAQPYVDVALDGLFDHLAGRMLRDATPPTIEDGVVAGFDTGQTSAPSEQTNRAFNWPVLVGSLGMSPAPLVEDAFRQALLFRMPVSTVPSKPFGVAVTVASGGASYTPPHTFSALPPGGPAILVQWDAVQMAQDEIVMQSSVFDPASAVDHDEWSTSLTPVGDNALIRARETFPNLCWTPGVIAIALSDTASGADDDAAVESQIALLCDGLLALYSAFVLDPLNFRQAPDGLDLFGAISLLIAPDAEPDWRSFVQALGRLRPPSLFDAPGSDEDRLKAMLTYLDALRATSKVELPSAANWCDDLRALGTRKMAQSFRQLIDWLAKAEGVTTFLLQVWSDTNLTGQAPLGDALRAAISGAFKLSDFSWRVRFASLSLPVRNAPGPAHDTSWMYLVKTMLAGDFAKIAAEVGARNKLIEDELLAPGSAFKLSAGAAHGKADAWRAFQTASEAITLPDSSRRWCTPHSAWTAEPEDLVVRLENLDGLATNRRYGLLIRRTTAPDWCCLHAGSAGVSDRGAAAVLLMDDAGKPLWTVHPRVSLVRDGFEQVYLDYFEKPLLYDWDAAASGEHVDNDDPLSQAALAPFVHAMPWRSWSLASGVVPMRSLAMTPVLWFYGTYDLALFHVGTGGVLPAAVAADAGWNGWQLLPKEQIPYADPVPSPAPPMPLPGAQIRYWRTVGVGGCAAAYKTVAGDDWRITRPSDVHLLASIVRTDASLPQADKLPAKALTDTILLARGVNSWDRLLIRVAAPFCSYQTYVRHLDRATPTHRTLGQILRCADLFMRNADPGSPSSDSSTLIPDPLNLRQDRDMAPLGEPPKSPPGGLQLGDPAVTHLIVSLSPVMSDIRTPLQRRAIPLASDDLDAIVRKIVNPDAPTIPELASVISATVRGPFIAAQRSTALSVSLTCAAPGTDAQITVSNGGVSIAIPSAEVWSLEICPAAIADDASQPLPFSPELISDASVYDSQSGNPPAPGEERTRPALVKVMAYEPGNAAARNYLMFGGFARLIEVADTNAASQIHGAGAAFAPPPDPGRTIDASTLYAQLSVAPQDGDLVVTLIPGKEPDGVAPGALTRLRYFYSASISWQVWRWLGRPVPPYPRNIDDDVPRAIVDLLATDNVGRRDAMSAAAQVPYFWDYAGFADRTPGPEVTQTNPLVCVWRQGMAPASVKLHREPLGHIARELVYRFQVTLNHRYANVYRKAAAMKLVSQALIPGDVLASRQIAPTLAADYQVADSWKRARRPAMLASRPAPPRVKLMLPLTQRASDDASSVASVLMVLNEEHGAVGGLAESLDAAIELTTRNYTAPAVRTERRLEVGPDPVSLTSLPKDWGTAPSLPGAGEFVGIRLDGPIGHTFDIGEPEGRYVASSYMAHATGNVTPWSLAKLRVRRVVLPEALAPGGAATSPDDGTQRIFTMNAFCSLPPLDKLDSTRIVLQWGTDANSPSLADLTLEQFRQAGDDIQFATAAPDGSTWFVSKSARLPSHWTHDAPDRTRSALALRVVVTQIKPAKLDPSGAVLAAPVWEIAVCVRSPASGWLRFAVAEASASAFEIEPQLNLSADVLAGGPFTRETQPCYSAYTQGNWVQFPLDLDRAIALCGVSNVRTTVKGNQLLLARWPTNAVFPWLENNNRYAAYVLATRKSNTGDVVRSGERFVGVFGPLPANSASLVLDRVHGDYGPTSIPDGDVCARILLVQALPSLPKATDDFWSAMFPPIDPGANGKDAAQRIVAMSSPLGDLQ